MTEWIKCSEKLPKEGQKVRFRKTEEPFGSRATFKNGKFCAAGILFSTDIMEWIPYPMPKTPKGS